MGGMMQHIADVFTGAAVLAGLWAALLWWASAKLPLEPDFTKPDPIYDRLPDAQGILARTVAALGANIEKTSKLNSKAAGWTAVSVALQAVATVLGRFVPPSL